jgi:hypothetical protein
MCNEAEALMQIASTFANTTIHIDDIDMFFQEYTETYFPTRRHSKEWALTTLQKHYQNIINKQNAEIGDNNAINIEHS